MGVSSDALGPKGGPRRTAIAGHKKGRFGPAIYRLELSRDANVSGKHFYFAGGAAEPGTPDDGISTGGNLSRPSRSIIFGYWSRAALASPS
jgi:hypothetical protein